MVAGGGQLGKDLAPGVGEFWKAEGSWWMRVCEAGGVTHPCIHTINFVLGPGLEGRDSRMWKTRPLLLIELVSTWREVTPDGRSRGGRVSGLTASDGEPWCVYAIVVASFVRSSYETYRVTVASSVVTLKDDFK